MPPGNTILILLHPPLRDGGVPPVAEVHDDTPASSDAPRPRLKFAAATAQMKASDG